MDLVYTFFENEVFQVYETAYDIPENGWIVGKHFCFWLSWEMLILENI